jgi:hypothetical protein
LALSARINFDLAVASCLALMRAGEQSAAQAFARIMSRLSRGEYAYAAGSVAALIEDEQRHDVQLSRAATGLPLVSTDFGARHFFRRLETREPGAPHFEALGIDSSLLIRSIDRDRSPD